jgi:hypothetical protein
VSNGNATVNMSGIRHPLPAANFANSRHSGPPKSAFLLRLQSFLGWEQDEERKSAALWETHLEHMGNKWGTQSQQRSIFRPGLQTSLFSKEAT